MLTHPWKNDIKSELLPGLEKIWRVQFEREILFALQIQRMRAENCWISWQSRNPLYLWSVRYSKAHSLISPNFASVSKFSATYAVILYLCCPCPFSHPYLTPSSQWDPMFLGSELRREVAMKRTWDHLKFGKLLSLMFLGVWISDSWPCCWGSKFDSRDT